MSVAISRGRSPYIQLVDDLFNNIPGTLGVGIAASPPWLNIFPNLRDDLARKSRQVAERIKALVLTNQKDIHEEFLGHRWAPIYAGAPAAGRL